MTYYLWQLLRDVYAELGQLQVAEATGGSATTAEVSDQDRGSFR